MPKIVGFYKKGGKTRPITQKPQNVTGRTVKGKSSLKKLTLTEVRALHEDRSEKAKVIDESLVAPITANHGKWSKNPNRLDVYGVDHFPIPMKRGDFDFNTKASLVESEKYYGVDLSDRSFIPHTDEEVWNTTRGKHVLGYVKSSEHGKIHFSPTTTRILKNGVIENATEFHSMNAVIHELGHTVGAVPRETRHGERVSSMGFYKNKVSKYT